LNKSGNSTVRPAVSADADSLTVLRSAFWTDQISKGTLDSPDLDPARLAGDTARLLERARTIVLVAAREETAIGYLYGQVKILPGMPPVGSIEEIFVVPEHRHANMAQTLVGEAIIRLQELGARRLQLRVLQGNAEGTAFWQRLGFHPSVTIYEYGKISPSHPAK
jgi:ribosomal protein S18 acetylase RimI-like enzyme